MYWNQRHSSSSMSDAGLTLTWDVLKFLFSFDVLNSLGGININMRCIEIVLQY